MGQILRYRINRTALLWGLSGMMLGSSLAGTLDDFEAAVSKSSDSSSSSPPPSRPSRDSHHHHHNDDSGFGDTIFFGTFRGIRWLLYDWWAYSDDGYSSPSFYNGGYGIPSKHDEGSPCMSFARFDYNYQYLEHDLDAGDFMMELGYKNFALLSRTTHYMEAGGDRMDINQGYAMVRVSNADDGINPGTMSIGLGIGGYEIDGNTRRSGPAATIPIMIYPDDCWGLEFRPSWASIDERTVGDYDVSASIGGKYAQLRVGYRWLWVQGSGHWLNGPHAGITISF